VLQPTSSRLPPLDIEACDESTHHLMADLTTPDGRTLNVFLTLARHPGLLRRYQPFLGKLLFGGKLPGRDREILILRIAWLCGSDYEWTQHVAFALREGLTNEEIARVADGAGAAGWSHFDRTLINAVDELWTSAKLSQGVWDDLRAEYDEMQLIEVPLVVGHYQMVAYFLGAAQVQLEPDTPSALPPRPAPSHAADDPVTNVRTDDASPSER
jgi:4-carboxymuconolactone decarboxylase